MAKIGLFIYLLSVMINYIKKTLKKKRYNHTKTSNYVRANKVASISIPNLAKASPISYVDRCT